MQGKPITLQPGEVFGKWTVLESAGKSAAGAYQVLCRCECGQLRTIASSRLAAGKTRGCHACRCHRTHGASKARNGKPSPEYQAWMDMHHRCRSKRPNVYKIYGARGITVCSEWAEFPPFLRDMGEKPSPEYTLDRIDGTKGYVKENCRWATETEQARNTSRNRYLTFEGRTMTFAEWAREVGIHESTLANRVDAGLSLEEVLRPDHRRWHYLTHQGRTLTLTAWAREIGLDANTLRYRLDQGTPVEEALQTPSSQGKKNLFKPKRSIV